MYPRICGVITVKSIHEAYSLIKNPQTKYCDLLELRLDYLECLDYDQISNLVNSIKIPLILTLRSNKEGGKFQGTEKQRIESLRNLIHLCPTYIDVELNIKEKDLTSLMMDANNNDVKTILSTHYFENTPDYNVLNNVLESGRKYYADIVKLITYARNIEDNNAILGLYKVSKEMGIDIVAFCMGELGLPSRLLCVFYDAAFTYASLNEQSAPGQLNAQVMNKIYDGLNSRCIKWK